ncbi:mitogen-activated protein kinase organizer 1 [Magnaporthiopsis poae ATCC 64411]|uniref:Mitogen-activated protein kinase organizer 1 n=1 Tax=Magnaporthiopsis poae (strain ATCC 64411 / 73-15) TaxID=644358 RepID=A0A0C4E4J1_MAGP6|nr:mitogen-activated protein kinase organizer 1 [Magnaporthiopsis poae ATCC 64411]
MAFPSRPVSQLLGSNGPVHAVAYSASPGTYILAGSADRSIRLYNPSPASSGPAAEGRLIQTYSAHGYEVLSTRAASGDEGTIQINDNSGPADCPDGSRLGACLRTYGGAAGSAPPTGAGAGSSEAGSNCLGAAAPPPPPPPWRNESLRVQSILGGGEKFVVAGDEMSAPPSDPSGTAAAASGGDEDGRVWAWDLLTGKTVAILSVPWGSAAGGERKRRAIGRDGKEKGRKNIVSCLAWREDGWGNQFCVGGSSGVVTVFGSA